MSTKNINPIEEKLRRLLLWKKTTKEKICVAADIRYNTLQNVFNPRRVTVSPYVIRSLRLAGIISAKEEREYDYWVQQNIPPRVRKSPLDNMENQPDTPEPILMEEDNAEEESENNEIEIEDEAEGAGRTDQ